MNDIRPAGNGKTDYINLKAHKAILASSLKYHARYLYLAMWTRADARSGRVWGNPSYPELVTLTGMSDSTVKRAMKELEANGWVQITRPAVADAIKRHDSNRYRLTIPENSRPGVTQIPGQDRGQEKPQVKAGASADPVSHRHPSSIRTINTPAALNGAAGVHEVGCRECGEKTRECTCGYEYLYPWCWSCNSDAEFSYINGKPTVRCLSEKAAPERKGKPKVADVPLSSIRTINAGAASSATLEKSAAPGRCTQSRIPRCHGCDRAVWECDETWKWDGTGTRSATCPGRDWRCECGGAVLQKFRDSGSAYFICCECQNEREMVGSDHG